MPSKYETAAAFILTWEGRYGSPDVKGVTDDIVAILKLLHQCERDGDSLEVAGDYVAGYVVDAFSLEDVNFDDDEDTTKAAPKTFADPHAHMDPDAPLVRLSLGPVFTPNKDEPESGTSA